MDSFAAPPEVSPREDGAVGLSGPQCVVPWGSEDGPVESGGDVLGVGGRRAGTAPLSVSEEKDGQIYTMSYVLILFAVSSVKMAHSLQHVNNWRS